MYIELTESAENELRNKTKSASDRIKLVYDAEGCGCAVSGIAAIWITDAAEKDDIPAETNSHDLPLFYMRRHEIFFEDRLRLDYREDRRAFALTSDNQIYGSNVQAVDRRSSVQAPSDARQ